jgi:uncharacterized damage-inducible protein DinB
MAAPLHPSEHRRIVAVTRHDLRRLVAAHDAVWDAWWPMLIGIPGATASCRIGGSFPSVLATTSHMVDGERYWQEHMDGGPAFGSRVSAAKSITRVGVIWREVQSRRLAWLATADPKAPVEFEPAAGGLAKVMTWECMIHVISHAHFHRGQLVSQCHSLGVTPPSRHLLGAFFGEFKDYDQARRIDR